MYFIARISVRHPHSTIMVWAAIIAMGILASLQLPIKLLPRLAIPQAVVVAENSGFGVEEMDTLIATPLENELYAIGGVRQVETMIRDGIVAIELLFDWSHSIEGLAVDIATSVDNVYLDLPNEVRKPTIFFNEAVETPIATLAIIPQDSAHSVSRIGEIVRHDIANILHAIPGVGGVHVLGDVDDEIAVLIDPPQMAHSGIALPEIATTIALAVVDGPVGKIVHNEKNRWVATRSNVGKPEDIGDIMVSSGDRANIAIEDIGTIELRSEKPTSLFLVDGQSAIGMTVFSGNEDNGMRVGNDIDAMVPYIADKYDNLLQVVPLNIESEEIAHSFFNLIGTILVGSGAAALVLYFLLRMWRYAIIIAAAIPVTLCCTMLPLYMAGISLNITSLLGIALGIGIIVDNSIIVMENLTRTKAKDEHAAAACMYEISAPLTASTLTSVVVFVPLLLLPDITGALFVQLSCAVVFVLLISLAVACSFVPALYLITMNHIPKKRWRCRAKRAAPRESYVRWYTLVLDSMHRRPAIVVSILILLCGMALLCGRALPVTLLPQGPSKRIELEINLGTDLAIEEIKDLLIPLQNEMMNVDGVEHVITTVGYDKESLEQKARSGHNGWAAHTILMMEHGVDISHGSEVNAALGALLHHPAIINFYIQRVRSHLENILDIGASIDYRIYGYDRDELLSAAHRFRDAIGAEFSAVHVYIDTRKDRRGTEFLPHADVLYHRGIDVRTLTTHLRTALRGTVAAHLNLDNRQIPIRVQFDKEHTGDLSVFANLTIPINGSSNRISELGMFTHNEGFVEVHRYNKRPSITLSIFSSQRERGDVAEFLNRHALLEGIDGEIISYKKLREVGTHVLVLIGAALLLIYLILGVQLGSAWLPLLAISMLIPAIAGSIIALWIGRMGLNLNSILGMLILTGTNVNSAILLISHYRSAERSFDAVCRASIFRLPSIGATLWTTLLALAPLILFGKESAHIETAVAIVGGLVVGTAATLSLIPILYWRFAASREKNHR